MPLTRTRGLAILVVSSLLFGVMAYAAKQATHRLGGGEVAFVRFVIGLAASAVVFAAGGAELRPVRYTFLILRGVFGGIAVLLYFLSIEALPSGTATLLNFTAPVFTAIFAGVFLGERLAPLCVAAMGIAGVGVVMVVLGQGRVLGGAYGWQILALVSAVASGAAVTSIRAARRTDSAWVVFAAFCLIGALSTLPSAAADWKHPTLEEWGWLLAVGLLAVVAQVLMTHALGAVEAAVSGIIAQITVVTAMALGHFLDAEPLTTFSALGAVLTLAGVSLAAHVSAKTFPVGTAIKKEKPVMGPP